MTSGRAIARSQIATFISPTTVTGITQVFTSFPKRINFQVNSTPGQLSRCAAVIFIESEKETRLAIGGAINGIKRIDYTVTIQLYHHSMQPNAEDAMADFDTVIDNLKVRLRSDHNFGDPTGVLIWQGAEGSGSSIDISYGEPLLANGSAIETWASVRFPVTQMINA